MPPVREISLDDAEKCHAAKAALFLDVRDPNSHEEGRIPGAVHLTRESFERFLAETAREQAIIVYCYHGNSSKMVVSMLEDEGFLDVQSMRGGFEGWRERSLPMTAEPLA